MAWSIACCLKKLIHALETSARWSRGPGKHLTLVSPPAQEQSHCRQEQRSCTWCPARVPLSWASVTFSHERSQTFSLWSDYVLHACTHQKPSHSDHPEFPKCLLKCHFFTVSELFSWCIKTSQSRHLTALVDFNSYCRFLLSYLTGSKSLQTAKSDYTILGENIGFSLSTASSEEA